MSFRSVNSPRLNRITVQGFAFTFQQRDGHLEPTQQRRFQVPLRQFPEGLHAVEAPLGFHIVRNVEDFLHQGHIRLAGGVPVNGVVHLVALAENVTGHRSAGPGMEQFIVFALKCVSHNTIFFTQ